MPYRHSVYSALPSAQAFCGDLVISPISHRRFMHFAHRYARARTFTCTHSPTAAGTYRESARARARSRTRRAGLLSRVTGENRGLATREFTATRSSSIVQHSRVSAFSLEIADAPLLMERQFSARSDLRCGSRASLRDIFQPISINRPG